MIFFHDYFVSSVLASSCIDYTLRFRARCFLIITKKSLFLRSTLKTLNDTRVVTNCLGTRQVGFHDTRWILHQVILPFIELQTGLYQAS